MISICIVCNISFKVKKQRNGKYCTAQCYWKSLKGKSLAPTTQFKKGQIPWIKGKKSPYAGAKHWHWGGGKTVNKNGYILIYRPDHPYAQKRGVIFEHRLVMEEQLGRYLTKEEAVHHLNGIKTDNRPKNLIVCSYSEHKIKYHPDNGKATRFA